MNYDAIICAGGRGVRTGLTYNKIFYKLKDNRTVLEHSLSLFIADDDCKKIIIPIRNDEQSLVIKNPKIVFANSGEERSDSVYNGLLKSNNNFVLVHDAARPYLSVNELNNLKEAVQIYGAAILALPLKDTIKYFEDDYIIKTIDRNKLVAALTPQAFKREWLLEGYQLREKNRQYSDDASLVEDKHKIKLVRGSIFNQKITFQEDL